MAATSPCMVRTLKQGRVMNDFTPALVVYFIFGKDSNSHVQVCVGCPVIVVLFVYRLLKN